MKTKNPNFISIVTEFLEWSIIRITVMWPIRFCYIQFIQNGIWAKFFVQSLEDERVMQIFSMVMIHHTFFKIQWCFYSRHVTNRWSIRNYGQHMCQILMCTILSWEKLTDMTNTLGCLKSTIIFWELRTINFINKAWCASTMTLTINSHAADRPSSISPVMNTLTHYALGTLAKTLIYCIHITRQSRLQLGLHQCTGVH